MKALREKAQVLLNAGGIGIWLMASGVGEQWRRRRRLAAAESQISNRERGGWGKWGCWGGGGERRLGKVRDERVGKKVRD